MRSLRRREITSIWPDPPSTVGSGGGVRGRFGGLLGGSWGSSGIDMGDLYAEIPLTTADLLSSFPIVNADATEEMARKAKMWLVKFTIVAVVVELFDEGIVQKDGKEWVC